MSERTPESWVLECVDRSLRVMPPELERRGFRDHAWKPRQVRRAIRNLVEAGSLAYTSELGTSFLEKRFDGPADLGKRIRAIPPLHPETGEDGRISIRMSQGAAFGSGRHPTTRLAVQTMEAVLEPGGLLPNDLRTHALDVGTGSGILALAALKLGMDQALATDIDPCALSEARENARLNGLERRMTVADAPLETLSGAFPLILANLRLPTLVESLPVFGNICPPGGVLVLSGFRPEERDSLESAAWKAGFACHDHRSLQGWAAMIFLHDNATGSI